MEAGFFLPRTIGFTKVPTFCTNSFITSVLDLLLVGWFAPSEFSVEVQPLGEPETTSDHAPVVSVDREDITVEVLLPEIDLPNIAVHIAPRQFLISSDIDEDGLQICQLIDLPYEVSMDGVDAEQTRNMVRVTAALA